MNDFPYLTEEHHQVRELVRDFAEKEVRPIAREHDLESKFPWATVKKMGELGFLGAPVVSGAGRRRDGLPLLSHHYRRVGTG